jgi:hypothetical protein
MYEPPLNDSTWIIVFALIALSNTLVNTLVTALVCWAVA